MALLPCAPEKNLRRRLEAHGSTLTLLGISIDVSSANDQPPFRNIDGTAMTLSAFLNAVTAATTNAAGVSVPGTLVKAIFDRFCLLHDSITEKAGQEPYVERLHDVVVAT